MAASMKLGKSQERIYSSGQLVQALRSGLSGVREQLGVLSILDGTASSWPGVNQALDDVEFLIDAAAHTTVKLEGDVAQAEAKYADAKSEVVTLKETLAMANTTCEELQAEGAARVAEVRQVRGDWGLPACMARQQQQARRLTGGSSGATLTGKGQQMGVAVCAAAAAWWLHACWQPLCMRDHALAHACSEVAEDVACPGWCQPGEPPPPGFRQAFGKVVQF
eukprot:365747-Chlamydomonas_euryale.AAC.34